MAQDHQGAAMSNNRLRVSAGLDSRISFWTPANIFALFVLHEDRNTLTLATSRPGQPPFMQDHIPSIGSIPENTTTGLFLLSKFTDYNFLGGCLHVTFKTKLASSLQFTSSHRYLPVYMNLLIFLYQNLTWIFFGFFDKLRGEWSIAWWCWASLQFPARSSCQHRLNPSKQHSRLLADRAIDVEDSDLLIICLINISTLSEFCFFCLLFLMELIFIFMKGWKLQHGVELGTILACYKITRAM